MLNILNRFRPADAGFLFRVGQAEHTLRGFFISPYAVCSACPTPDLFFLLELMKGVIELGKHQPDTVVAATVRGVVDDTN